MRTHAHADHVELAAIALLVSGGSRLAALTSLRKDFAFTIKESLRALGAVDRSSFASELALAGVEPYGLETHLREVG